MLHPIIQADLQEIASAPLRWNELTGRTVLVTGAAGFLPALMVETLLYLNQSRQLSCRVLGQVRNLERGARRFLEYRDRSDLRLVEGDVSTGCPLSDRCDVIVHAASQASPMYYDSDPVGTMTANLLGSYHLLEIARERGCEKFLFFSSGEVYGQAAPDKVPTGEADYGYLDILNHRTCYGESKRAAETLAVSYAHQFGIPAVIVRPFHTYGPGMTLDDGRVFADFIRDVVQRRNLVLRSDGKAVRAFCYLADAVRGFFTVLLLGKSGQAYNVGNPAGALSIRELADLLVDSDAGRGLSVDWVGKPQPGYMPSPIAINIPKVDALQALGWQARYTPAEGFARTIEYFKTMNSNG